MSSLPLVAAQPAPAAPPAASASASPRPSPESVRIARNGGPPDTPNAGELENGNDARLEHLLQLVAEAEVVLVQQASRELARQATTSSADEQLESNDTVGAVAVADEVRIIPASDRPTLLSDAAALPLA